EVPDYLITPVFGSTQRLPRLLGVAGAADLVLWGRRLRGAEAEQAGLVDGTLGIGSAARDLDEAIAPIAASGWRKPSRRAAGPAAGGGGDGRRGRARRGGGADRAARAAAPAALPSRAAAARAAVPARVDDGGGDGGGAAVVRRDRRRARGGPGVRVVRDAT